MRRASPFLLVLLLVLAPTAAEEEEEDPTPSHILSITFFRQGYGAGERVDVEVYAQDADKVAEASLKLRSPDGQVLVPESCAGDGRGNSSNTARITCHIWLPDRAPSGTYVVHEVTVTDEDGRITEWDEDSLPEDDDVQREVEVEGASPETDPPVLVFVRFSDSVARGQSLEVSLKAQDASGVKTARLVFEDVEDRRDTLECDGGGNTSLVCQLKIKEDAPYGDRFLVRVVLEDVGGFGATYRHGIDYEEDEDHSVRFTVGPGFNDTQAPVLKAYRMPKDPVRAGGTFQVEVDAVDQVSVERVLIMTASRIGDHPILLEDCQGLGKPQVTAVCNGTVPKDHPLGFTKLQWISLRDLTGNEEKYPVGEPPEDPERHSELLLGVAVHVEPDPLALETRAKGPIAGLAPAWPEAVPGRVLPVFVAHGEDPVKSIGFRFANSAGNTLGVDGCRADAYPMPGGFRCLVIVPPRADLGEYRLVSAEAVVAGGAKQVPLDPDEAPSFRVLAQAKPVLDVMPDGWQEHVEEGVTLASYNAPPVSAPSRSTPAANASVDSQDRDKPARSTPAVGVAVGIGVLALALARRR